MGGGRKERKEIKTKLKIKNIWRSQQGKKIILRKKKKKEKRKERQKIIEKKDIRNKERIKLKLGARDQIGRENKKIQKKKKTTVFFFLITLTLFNHTIMDFVKVFLVLMAAMNLLF